LIERLERSGFLAVRRPAITGGTALGAGFDQRVQRVAKHFSIWFVTTSHGDRRALGLRSMAATMAAASPTQPTTD